MKQDGFTIIFEHTLMINRKLTEALNGPNEILDWQARLTIHPPTLHRTLHP
jgi:hypothetical protein